MLSFSIGINPRAKPGYIHNQIVLGTVTMGIGDSRELEGKNESDWSFHITTTRPTVKLDRKILIENGQFTL